MYQTILFIYFLSHRGHGSTEVKHSPTSKVEGSNHGHYVGKFVVAYQWSAVYSTKP